MNLLDEICRAFIFAAATTKNTRELSKTIIDMVPHGRKVRKNETESKDYENYTFSIFDLIHGGFQKDNLIKMLTAHRNADKNMCSKKLIAWENEISKDRILDVFHGAQG